MATVSSHILDSVSGASAVGIRVALYRIGDAAEKLVVFDVTSDAEGRVVESVEVDESNSQCEYELVFHSVEYFATQSLPQQNSSVMQTVVIRFSMPDADKRYHLPIMLSPHSYSVWSSQ